MYEKLSNALLIFWIESTPNAAQWMSRCALSTLLGMRSVHTPHLMPGVVSADSRDRRGRPRPGPVRRPGEEDLAATAGSGLLRRFTSVSILEQALKMHSFFCWQLMQRSQGGFRHLNKKHKWLVTKRSIFFYFYLSQILSLPN